MADGDKAQQVFTNTELATMDQLLQKLKTVDKSAQNINLKLERLIEESARTERASEPLPSPLPRPEPTKDQPASSVPKNIGNVTQPINITSEENIFTPDSSDEIVEPTVPNTAAIQTLPAKEPVSLKEEIPSTLDQPDVQEKIKVEELKPVVNNIENTSINVLPATTEKLEKTIEPVPLTEREPTSVQTSKFEPQIIEKVVPITNTVQTVETVVTPGPTPEPQIVEVPIKQESPIEPLTKEPTIIAESPAPVLPSPTQLPVDSKPSVAPVVNVNVVESSKTGEAKPEVTDISTPLPTPLPTPVPTIIESPTAQSAPQPQVEPVLPPPAPKEFNVTTETTKEIPSVITEPEMKAPQENLSLADESLVTITNNIDKLTNVINRGQDKLTASVEALTTSVNEILKMLPNIQTNTQQQAAAAPRNGKTSRVDTSSIISNYRQGLKLPTRGFTQNTVFPGGNSIS